VQVGAVKIYVATVEALKKKERQDETQFTTKIAGETSLDPNYLFCKFSFSVARLMHYYAKTDLSCPLMWETLYVRLYFHHIWIMWIPILI
jgi:hypothetical protein